MDRSISSTSELSAGEWAKTTPFKQERTLARWIALYCEDEKEKWL